MPHQQILPPFPTVDDTIDDVALTPYNHPECTFNFEGWHEASQRGVLILLPCSPLSITAATSTDRSSEAVIHNVQLQFQPQGSKGKAPV